MSILYDEGQQAIATESRRILEARVHKDDLLPLLQTSGRYHEAFWATAKEQGWTALALPEAHGGLALGLVELGLIAVSYTHLDVYKRQGISDRALAIAAKVEAFVRETVVPYEKDPRRDHHGAPTDELVMEMREHARAAGVLTPHILSDGSHLNQRETAVVLIKSGLSPLGPLACNTMAPDEGNMYPVSYTHLDVYKRQSHPPGAIRSAAKASANSPRVFRGQSRLTTALRRTRATARFRTPPPRGPRWALSSVGRATDF